MASSLELILKELDDEMMASADFKRLSIDYFARLADKGEVEALVFVYQNEAIHQPIDLAHGAYFIGKACDPETTKRLLIPLLKHPKGYVREGATYGLRFVIEDPEVRIAIKFALDVEVFASVRHVFEYTLRMRRNQHE